MSTQAHTLAPSHVPQRAEDVIHMFIWVSHGGNVSAINNYYPIETRLQAILLYSKPFQSINTAEVQEYVSNPCKLVIGTCAYAPINGNVYLPPLTFNNPARAETVIRSFTGLYYVTIGSRGSSHSITDCNIISHQTVLDDNDLWTKYGTNNIPYSTIFTLVTEKCIERGLMPENVLLGIIACQNQTYAEKYQPKITNLIPKIIAPPPTTTIYTLTNKPENTFVSLTILPYKNNLPTTWNALAGLKTQGCALNVLAFFGIIEENKAREQTVCLSIKGTSIFKIVDYIYNYLITTQAQSLPLPSGFFILRTELGNGLIIIYEWLKTATPTSNFVVVFKMYNKTYYKGKPSQIGHTVSIIKNGSKIHFFDPQVQIHAELNVEHFFSNRIQTAQTLNGFYGHTNYWTVIDIIYSVNALQSPTDQIRNIPIELFVTEVQKGVHGIDFILDRTDDTKHGGNYTKKRKKHNKYRKNHRKNNSIKNKKYKIN